MYISKLEQLDIYLKKSLIYLMLNWYKKDTGLVACALIENGKKFVFSTSKISKQYWFHAERNAIRKFSSTYGKPSPNAVIVTTLSPCMLDMENRYGVSCTNLIKKMNIHRIHCGALDSSHVKKVEEYKKLNLQVSVTRDKELAKICKNLRKLLFTFTKNNNNLLAIKKSFRLQIFYTLIN